MNNRDRVVVVAAGDDTGRLGTIVDFEFNGNVSVHFDHPADKPCERRSFLRTDLATVKPNTHLKD